MVRSTVPDLESSLCARQRNHLREVFMAASEVELSYPVIFLLIPINITLLYYNVLQCYINLTIIMCSII